MFWVVRDVPQHSGQAQTERHPWLIFHSRNVMLSMVALLCAMTGVFVLSAMVPNYLIDYLRLTTSQMGFVTSAIGFGGFFGQFAVPGLSDMFGRRIMAVSSFTAAALLIVVLARTGANSTILFGLLFVISFFCLGIIALLTGPVATESAPAGLIFIGHWRCGWFG